jgi:hypothetical protein
MSQEVTSGSWRAWGAAELRNGTSSEHFFAWIPWRRRLLVRWEFYPLNFLGLFQLTAICILLRHF